MPPSDVQRNPKDQATKCDDLDILMRPTESEAHANLDEQLSLEKSRAKNDTYRSSADTNNHDRIMPSVFSSYWLVGAGLLGWSCRGRAKESSTARKRRWYVECESVEEGVRFVEVSRCLSLTHI